MHLKIKNTLHQKCKMIDCAKLQIAKDEKPQYWSLIADETHDCSATEQLSICIKYVSDSSEARTWMHNI